jgi:hypothetical protein
MRICDEPSPIRGELMATFKDSKLILTLFIPIVILLYINILILDISNSDAYWYSDRIKFFCIFLCFATSLSISRKGISIKDTTLLQLGLFFTVISDFFLVILNWNTLGIAVFCVVQVLYIIRYYPKINIQKLLKLTLLFILLILSYKILIPKFNLLYTIALIYAIFLVKSVFYSFKVLTNNTLPKINSVMVSIGMALFFLCDINVAASTILYTINNTTFVQVINISEFLIWFFYIPSQILLTLSGFLWKL